MLGFSNNVTAASVRIESVSDIRIRIRVHNLPAEICHLCS